MITVDEWAEGIPEEIAGFTFLLAFFSSATSEALTEKKKQIDFGIPQPPLKQWLSFYTEEHRIVDHLQSFLAPKTFLSLLGETESSQYKKDELPLDFLQKLKDIFHQPETLFFLKVFAPCMIHHNKSPNALLKQARLGKKASFEKILRLDNSVIFDEELSELFHQIKVKRKKQTYDDVLLAFTKTTSGKTDPKKIKTLIAGLISLISEEMGYRLKEPKIRGLFDAISNEQFGIDDQEIPDDPGMFSQAIKRERRQWSKLIKPFKS